jgi:hypothetical protein
VLFWKCEVKGREREKEKKREIIWSRRYIFHEKLTSINNKKKQFKFIVT